MGRMFLSGQTTCALLLGAGLLLRAQAAIRPAEHATDEATKTRPAEMTGDHPAPRPAVVQAPQGVRSARTVQKSSHKRKGFTHRDARHRERKCGGVALATRGIRCG
jgi:YHS domain-containing protein